MITAGPPVGSADSASAAEKVVPSADVSSIVSADAPPAMRGRTRSAGRSGGWASKAKHTAALLGVVWSGATRILRRRRSRSAAAVVAARAFDLGSALAAAPAAAVVVAVRARPPSERGDHDHDHNDDDRQRDEDRAGELPGAQVLLAHHSPPARKCPAEVSHVSASRTNTHVPSTGRKRPSPCHHRITATLRPSTTSSAKPVNRCSPASSSNPNRTRQASATTTTKTRITSPDARWVNEATREPRKGGRTLP